MSLLNYYITINSYEVLVAYIRERRYVLNISALNHIRCFLTLAEGKILRKGPEYSQVVLNYLLDVNLFFIKFLRNLELAHQIRLLLLLLFVKILLLQSLDLL